MWKIDIVCLQETKLELVKRAVVRSLWECWCMDWCNMGSMGNFGSILLMLNGRVVEKREEYAGEFIVFCSFRNVHVGFCR